MGKIAIIGCGLIGQGWAAVFAQAGHDVSMHDISPEAADRALKAMETRISDLAEFDLIAPSEAPHVLGRITVASSLEDALDSAIYVQENGPEDVGTKREITQTLDTIAGKDVPIASSTSGIAASRYCEGIKGRHRCLVVHPINPPHLIPAVEIVPTPWTGQTIVSKVNELMLQCRRETIVLNQDLEIGIVLGQQRIEGSFQRRLGIVGEDGEGHERPVCRVFGGTHSAITSTRGTKVIHLPPAAT